MKMKAFVRVCLLGSYCLCYNAGFGATKFQVICQHDFEGPNALQGWTAGAAIEPGCQGRGAAALQQAQADGANTIHLNIPIETFRGCTVRGSVMVKAENVTAKPNPWNGIKCMLMIETPGGTQWPQASIGIGTFDWQRAAFTTKIPADATRAHLILGLEKVGGKVWFDDLKLTVAKLPPPTTVRPIPGPMFKGHDLPRLRGAMIGPRIDEEGLRTFGRDWNGNLIRWQLIRHLRPGQQSALDDFDPWLEGELQRLDKALPLCEQYGIHVLIDLHSPPGGKATVSGYVGSDAGLFTAKRAQDKFVEAWQRMARRYKEAKPVWGYDLANEPVEELVEEGCDDWPDLALRAARAIRAIDPQRAIIVEPNQWGSPGGLTEFVPLDVPNVVYSVHMYIPHQFTHQGVHEKGTACVYPGEIAGKHWDKEQLEAALKPAVEFQQKYNAHIYIGEFSAIRWAPENSAYRYLKDVIEIFEKHEWDWSYHAFREWQGWSVEYGEDPRNNARADRPTDRQRLLMDWFKKNQKPSWTGKQ